MDRNEAVIDRMSARQIENRERIKELEAEVSRLQSIADNNAAQAMALEAELAESNSINQRQAALIVKIESCRQRERDALLPISRLRNELQLTEEMVANAKQALKGG